MDSRTAVNALIDVDPGFVDLCKTLLGDAVDASEVWEFMYGRDQVVKMSPDMADLHVPVSRGKLRPTGNRKVRKDDDEDGYDVVWSGEIAKMDTDRREVFGWASVVEIDGQPVVDRQGDFITPDEIERAAYQYVMKSRKGGRQHRRNPDGEAFHASDLIESVVFTDEKIAKMGLPDDFPRGWWTGFKVHDEDTWEAVKKGDVTSFSVHGRGKRVPVAEVDL